MLEKLKEEPVRVRLYAIAIAVLALCQMYDWVDQNQAVAILGVLGAVLAVGSAELIRKDVTPTIKVLDPVTGAPTGEYVAPSVKVINTPEPSVAPPISDEPGEPIDDDADDLPTDLG